MQTREFAEVVNQIHEKHPIYGKGAYFFVRKALDYTLAKTTKSEVKPAGRHVSGQELLDGIREYALNEFGPMTRTVFREWNVNKSADFGRIVFLLVDHGVLGKTDRDSIRDFEDHYDFFEAFEQPFLPKNKKPGKRTRGRRSTEGGEGGDKT